MSGILYLCATPIGNLEDITLRVLRTLKEADLIAAEDTRNTIKLLNHFNIKTPMTSYHEHNKTSKAVYLVGRLLDGINIALVTDAGTPGISDPGEEIVKKAYEAGIQVTSLPGACACITALTLSGLPTRRFAFEAFLPSDKKERKTINTLSELYSTLGNRKITICRELTKIHETVQLTTLQEAENYYRQNQPKGEYVLILEGCSIDEIETKKQENWQQISISSHMDIYLSKGIPKKEAMKKVASDRGISKRDVYNYLLNSNE